MDPSSTSESPSSAGAGGNEAFQLLSDETRIGILRVLWDAHDPAQETPVRFADLRERLGVEDPGRLNYHLNKLIDRFVRRTDAGYELMDSGKRVVRMLLSGTAIDNPEIDPVAVDISCWYCGGGVEWSYRDGWRYLECTSCDARCVESFPPGVISKNEFPPSGLRDRTPNEINEADRVWGAHRRASVMDGVCPECAGDMPVTAIDICEDHRPDWDEYQFCENCGSIFRMLVSHVCEGCKYRWRMPTLFYPSRQSALIAFFYEHGVEFDLATYEQRTLLLDFEEDLVSMDPLRIRISIPLENEVLQFTYDERMELMKESRRERQP
ncbi:ArsR family transcriptional regulator [Haloterrigena sp. H1]|uniref:winged helix-turn-helix domain-containing protein n=1 Tax=Haloterrigena sp. H1 TaxID=2552943 RepID=UPI00110F1645|nr:winged helix-turn-helix domain-containing protein [Haloterrigena sp. H1]TMT81714.1 ArsR family transcriptional regulator [Haloterrigena sp. H1]